MGSIYFESRNYFVGDFVNDSLGLVYGEITEAAVNLFDYLLS
jgi:hypothetical protein